MRFLAREMRFLGRMRSYRQMLVTRIDKISVIKRSNEIVEELHRQIESTTKSRNEAREQIEQRYFVSDLTSILHEKTTDFVAGRNQEVKSLHLLFNFVKV
ncbi:hypothetical protein L1887_20334 [Cichorium endivia]|nr:hypothetical protein L1887_20334 [Cichorium endivia]